MKCVIQRVTSSKVSVAGQVVGQIGIGMNILVGVSDQDDESIILKMAEKIVNLRIFKDEKDLMNRSILDIKGEILLISQFTLLADCRKGRRPSFVHAASPEIARDLYVELVKAIGDYGIRVATGNFGEYMQVEISNDGPVTIILDSELI